VTDTRKARQARKARRELVDGPRVKRLRRALAPDGAANAPDGG
jgi:hypothetical protein